GWRRQAGPDWDSGQMQKSADTPSGTPPYWLVFLVLAFARLALAAGQPILAIGGAGPDGGNFLRGALTILHGQWLGESDFPTLIKGPGYPLFVSANHWLGFPLYLAEIGLYVLACALLITALKPLLPGVWVRVGLFALLLFSPGSFEGQTYRLL